MREEIQAAREAAESYEPRNEGEESHVLLIRSLLGDAMQRVALLDDFAHQHESQQAVNNAQQALYDAQAAASAPAPTATPAPAQDQPAPAIVSVAEETA